MADQSLNVTFSQVSQADAAAVKAAVVVAAGAPSRGVARHLDAVLSAVKTGGVRVYLT